MIRRPPRSTPLYSSAASDVYNRQLVVLDQMEHKVVLVLQDLKEPKEIKVLREVLVITDLRVLLVQLEVKVTMGMVHKGHQDLLHPQTIQEQQVLKGT